MRFSKEMIRQNMVRGVVISVGNHGVQVEPEKWKGRCHRPSASPGWSSQSPGLPGKHLAQTGPDWLMAGELCLL